MLAVTDSVYGARNGTQGTVANVGAEAGGGTNQDEVGFALVAGLNVSGPEAVRKKSQTVPVL